MKEQIVRSLVKTDAGYVPLEQATEEEKAAFGEFVLQCLGKVMAGE